MDILRRLALLRTDFTDYDPMFSLIWIPATLAAAFLQVARNALQRGLMSRSGPWAATLVRFLFGLPFAAAMSLTAWLLTPGAALHPSAHFWVMAMTGAVCQVMATAALLTAMARAGFAVGTATQQSALPLSAVLGLLFFHDHLSAVSWWGVALASLGLGVLTWPAEASGPRPVTGGLFGLLSGLAFGYALNAYRRAALTLDPLHPILSALATVTATQAAQALVLTTVLMLWDPPALRAVFRAWRESLGAGLCGALASGAWLIALALAPAASVRAVGVVETPIAALAGRRLFRERLGPRQVVSGAAVLVGVAMTALG